MNQEKQIIFEVRGSVGIITLNRPKALNALSFEMIREISALLDAWENDASVQCVVFQGEGRAFCAGGDIKSFYETVAAYRLGEIDMEQAAYFFDWEYSLNKRLFHYPKPTIALMDGIVMGGGYGIAGNCQHRIASENTVFAMPEVGIGFFPDVGALYHFQKIKEREYARYLLMTGRSIDAASVFALNMADYSLETDDYDLFFNSLNEDGCNQALKQLGSQTVRETPFEDYCNEIKDAFADSDVKAVFARLEGIGSDWSKETLTLLKTRSLISVCVTAQYFEVSQKWSFDQVISQDFILAQHFIEDSDMVEGIRAMLIDKCNNPKWLYDRLYKLNDLNIGRFFASAAYDLGILKGMPL